MFASRARFHGELMCRLKNLGWFQLLGHLQSGGSTWLGLLKGPRIKRPTFWWQLTNSQNGSKQSRSVSVTRQRRFNSSKRWFSRFGFPHNIINDNGTNLSKGAMKEFCQHEHIRLDVSSVAHPQSNGQAERANQEILRGIKPWLMVPLQRTLGCWVEELPLVQWSINTTPNRSMGYTPFYVLLLPQKQCWQKPGRDSLVLYLFFSVSL